MFPFHIKPQVLELKTRRFTESSMCLFSIMSLGFLLFGVVIPDSRLLVCCMVDWPGCTRMRISNHFQSVNQSIKNTSHVYIMIKFYPKGNYFYNETRGKKINWLIDWLTDASYGYPKLEVTQYSVFTKVIKPWETIKKGENKNYIYI